MSELKTIEIFARSRGRAACRGCRATIEWAEIVATGRRMCFDEVVVLSTHEDLAGRAVEVVDLTKNHWATCPAASQFKRKVARS